MKKCYLFLPKNRVLAGLLTAFAATTPLVLQAQTAPAKQWDKTIGGRSVDRLTALQQTEDGGYILGGSSWAEYNGTTDMNSKIRHNYWVVKLDAKGKKTWDKTFGGNNFDELFSLQQTEDGGYILGGRSDSDISGDKSQASKGGSDYWVVRLDAKGNKIWDKTIGGNQEEYFTSVQQTADGGFLVGGYSHSDISGDKSQDSKGMNDFWVIKLDADGNKIWDKTFGGIWDEYLGSLQQTTDGGYILGGLSNSDISGDKSQPSQGYDDYWVIKLDANGNKLWDKTFGGSGADAILSLQQTSDGGYILGGWSGSEISGDKTEASQGIIDYWVVKIDSKGNKRWDKTFGGSDRDDLYTVRQTADGGYILGGDSESPISGDKTQASKGKGDFWLVKLDASGNKLWDNTIGGSEFDYFSSLQQTYDDGYIIGGYTESPISGDKSQDPKGWFDFWVVKLGGKYTNMEANISPNPSQGKFNLQFSNLYTPTVEVKVYDLMGHTVLQQNLKVSKKQYSQEITLPKAQGIYLLQLTAGDQHLNRKIVVE